MKYILNTIVALFLFTSILRADCLIYLPPESRQHNQGPSCVFASITTCMRCAHLWKEADAFWEKDRGPGNPDNTKARLDRSGVKYKMIFHTDEKAIIAAIESGRPVALTWGGKHFVNLVGRIKGNAYIVDNRWPKSYTVVPWASFIAEHKRCGGWGVIILDGFASHPLTKEEDLKKFENDINNVGHGKGGRRHI